MADTRDLKSLVKYLTCGFESRLRHCDWVCHSVLAHPPDLLGDLRELFAPVVAEDFAIAARHAAPVGVEDLVLGLGLDGRGRDLVLREPVDDLVRAPVPCADGAPPRSAVERRYSTAIKASVVLPLPRGSWICTGRQSRSARSSSATAL